MKSGKSFIQQLQDKEKQAVKELESIIKKGKPIPKDTDKELLAKAAKKVAKNKHYNPESIAEVMQELKEMGWLDETPAEAELKKAAKAKISAKSPIEGYVYVDVEKAAELSKADIQLTKELQFAAKYSMQQQQMAHQKAMDEMQQQQFAEHVKKAYDQPPTTPEAYQEYLQSNTKFTGQLKNWTFDPDALKSAFGLPKEEPHPDMHDVSMGLKIGPEDINKDGMVEVDLSGHAAAVFDPKTGDIQYVSSEAGVGNVQGEKVYITGSKQSYLESHNEGKVKLPYDFCRLQESPTYRKAFFKMLDRRMGNHAPAKAICLDHHGEWVALVEEPKTFPLVDRWMGGLAQYSLRQMNLTITPPMGVSHIPNSLITREFKVKRDWWNRRRFAELKMRNAS